MNIEVNLYISVMVLIIKTCLIKPIYLFNVYCYICIHLYVRGGVDGYMHFPVQFMNRLHQIDPAVFSIMSCWALLRDSLFLYFIVRSVLFVHYGVATYI
jgi:hypothetical protein